MAPRIAGAEQSIRGDGRIGALDVHQLRFAEHGHVTDQMCGGLAEHHSARRSGRFHPLRHPDVHTDGGVTPWARIDVANDDLTGVQSDP